MKVHYHHGHGLAGHGPEEPGLCLTLDILAEDVRQELGEIIDGWVDQSREEHGRSLRLRGTRPSNGSDPTGYEGSWESIADAALRALECLDRADTVDTLRLNMRPERQRAPLYVSAPDMWQAELRRLLFGRDTYPLNTDLRGYHRFYVYECTEWRCLLNEHDTDYNPSATDSPGAGGYVPCACRDCMEVLVWSPEDGEAPYCHACVDEDCRDRDRGECPVVPEGDE